VLSPTNYRPETAVSIHRPTPYHREGLFRSQSDATLVPDAAGVADAWLGWVGLTWPVGGVLLGSPPTPEGAPFRDNLSDTMAISGYMP
jgi:hypothetical protein